MICTQCNYQWESRIDTPKSCPRCKRRFDYVVVNKEEVAA